MVNKTVRFLRGTRKGKNGLRTLMGLLRQSVFGRLACYEGVNGATRLARDPGLSVAMPLRGKPCFATYIL